MKNGVAIPNADATNALSADPQALIQAGPVETLTIDLARREPRPWRQFWVGFGIFSLGQIALMILLIIGTLWAGGLGSDGKVSFGIDLGDNGLKLSGTDAGDLYANSWPGLAIGLGAQAVIAVIGFLRVIPRLTGRKPYELMGPGAWREFGIGLALGAIPIALAVGILAVLGDFRITDTSLNTGIVTGLMIGVGAAFAEEIFFRGFVLRLLDKRFGSWAAMISVSLLFGLIHLSNPEATLWGAIAIVLSAGPLLNAAYLLTRRLWLPIGIHLAWNAVQSGVFGINVSGIGSGRGLFASELSGPEFLSGGGMGIEGSVILVVIALGIGIALTVQADRIGRMLPRRR